MEPQFRVRPPRPPELKTAFTDGSTGLEILQTMQPIGNTTDDGFCQTTMVIGWGPCFPW